MQGADDVLVPYYSTNMLNVRPAVLSSLDISVCVEQEGANSSTVMLLLAYMLCMLPLGAATASYLSRIDVLAGSSYSTEEWKNWTMPAIATATSKKGDVVQSFQSNQNMYLLVM